MAERDLKAAIVEDLDPADRVGLARDELVDAVDRVQVTRGQALRRETAP